MTRLPSTPQLLQRKQRRLRNQRPQYCTTTLLTKWPAEMDRTPTWRSLPGTLMGWGPGWKRRAWMWVCSGHGKAQVSCQADEEFWEKSVNSNAFNASHLCSFFPSGCVRKIQMFCACKRPSVQRKTSLLISPQCLSTRTSTGLSQMTRRIMPFLPPPFLY